MADGFRVYARSTTTLERNDLVSLPAALTDPDAPPLAASILRGRAAIGEAAEVLLAVPDAALTRVWLFRGIDTEGGVRFGMSKTLLGEARSVKAVVET